MLLSSGEIIIIIVYRSTSMQHESLDANRSFLNCIHKLTDVNYSIILAGDFNLSWIDWSFTTNSTNLTHDLFLDFIISRSLEQLNTSLTRGHNIRDLVMADDLSRISNISSSPPLGASDHDIIEFSITVDPSSTKTLHSLQIRNHAKCNSTLLNKISAQ